MDGPETGDAFGALLQAGLQDRAATGVIERDDGLVTPHAAAGYFTAVDEWPALERTACERASGRVLDLGSGAGRHALHLQKRGVDVVALDPSPGACAVARAQGVRDVREAGIEDVAKLGERFDTFLLLGNNLGLLGSREAAPRLLAGLAASAAPGARILGANLDPSGSPDADHAAYQQCNKDAGRLAGQLRLRVRYRRLADAWFDYLLCSPAELGELVAESPWQLAHVEEDGAGYLAELRMRDRSTT
ncbi:class I SAM-dependent methyltransferase [Tenggerimyces flavus]|uniref:Class I SAM-dependent methyltransferase n=1 Tax=Tenggerimyces flavus TaxID=1708749 RepID=A0ABV7YGY2_9ACTN|nr:class I SAM-dependent methyltransferase [Tenggerimyces flavus]MBM7789247.1 SAM-dependent methyltransferase [Tenggerimyces flavus]